MTAPRGKAIYARDPAYYPDGDPCRYALDMGCQWIALHDAASSDDLFRHGQELGLGVYIWQGPGAWLPNTWERTLYSHAERVDRLGLTGMVCDVEHANQWQGHDQALADLITGLASASNTFDSVGFTSFPTWPWFRDVAAAAPRMWGSPQLYGIVSPGTPAELVRRASPWKAAFADVTPSLAAWKRSPAEQADYLEHFTTERGAIFWQSVTNAGAILPRVGTEAFAVLRDWNVEQPFAPWHEGIGGGGRRSFLSVFADHALRPTRLRRS